MEDNYSWSEQMSLYGHVLYQHRKIDTIYHDNFSHSCVPSSEKRAKLRSKRKKKH